jgi:hypothetical protein
MSRTVWNRVWTTRKLRIGPYTVPVNTELPFFHMDNKRQMVELHDGTIVPKRFLATTPPTMDCIAGALVYVHQQGYWRWTQRGAKGVTE